MIAVRLCLSAKTIAIFLLLICGWLAALAERTSALKTGESLKAYWKHEVDMKRTGWTDLSSKTSPHYLIDDVAHLPLPTGSGDLEYGRVPFKFQLAFSESYLLTPWISILNDQRRPLSLVRVIFLYDGDDVVGHPKVELIYDENPDGVSRLLPKKTVRVAYRWRERPTHTLQVALNMQILFASVMIISLSLVIFLSVDTSELLNIKLSGVRTQQR